MGTSASQSSPRSGRSATNWAAVAAGYRSPNVPIDRVIQEVWRAAQSEPTTNWRALLKSPGVALCLDASALGGTREQALSSVTREISRSHQSSVAADVAKRALVQGFSLSDDPRHGFAQALFSEVTNYLVSRDLSGHVGETFRNQRVSEAMEFKQRIRGQVREQVARLINEQGLPSRGDRQAWERFVDSAVTMLSG